MEVPDDRSTELAVAVVVVSGMAMATVMATIPAHVHARPTTGQVSRWSGRPAHAFGTGGFGGTDDAAIGGPYAGCHD